MFKFPLILIFILNHLPIFHKKLCIAGCKYVNKVFIIIGTSKFVGVKEQYR